jgi:hypothetical protein
MPRAVGVTRVSNVKSSPGVSVVAIFPPCDCARAIGCVEQPDLQDHDDVQREDAKTMGCSSITALASLVRQLDLEENSIRSMSTLEII